MCLASLPQYALLMWIEIAFLCVQVKVLETLHTTAARELVSFIESEPIPKESAHAKALEEQPE